MVNDKLLIINEENSKEKLTIDNSQFTIESGQ